MFRGHHEHVRLGHVAVGQQDTSRGGQHLCSASSSRTQAQRHDDSHDDLLVADGRLTHAARPDLNAAGLWMTM